MTASKTFVALLRGINVGGKSLISMAELRALFSSLGFEDVATYIQSGNVVFRSPSAGEGAVVAKLEREIAGAFAVSPSVLLRTPAQLEAIAASNPYLSRKADLSKLHVVFLDPGSRRAHRSKARPGAIPARRVHPQGTRDLSPPAARRRPVEAESRLLRARARGARDAEELEHAAEADRAVAPLISASRDRR